MYATKHGDARIVNHSSGGRHMTPNQCLEQKYFEKNGGNLGGSDMGQNGFSGAPYERYFQTKLANAVFTKALHQKLLSSAKKSGNNNKVRAICADPGMSATSLADHMVPDGSPSPMAAFGKLNNRFNFYVTDEPQKSTCVLS